MNTPKTAPLLRPLYTVGLVFGACTLAAAYVGGTVAAGLAVLSAIAFLIALCRRRRRQNATLMAVLLSAVTAFCVYAAREQLIVIPLQAQSGATLSLNVNVRESHPSTGRTAAYTVTVQSGDLPAGTRLQLWLSPGEDTPPTPGDTLSGAFTVYGTDTYRAYRVYLTASSSAEALTVTPGEPSRLVRWRQTLLNAPDLLLGGEVSGLVRAVCFGDKSGLSDDTLDAFAQVGLSHIVAVSGFHMNLIVMGLLALLRRLGCHRRLVALAVLPFPLIFAWMAGFSYSALRAGAMCLVTLSGILFRRLPDARNSLGAAVLLILLLDFSAVYDLGFQLSVVSTLGLLVSTDESARRTRSPRRPEWVQSLGSALRAGVAATLATLPLVALHFQSVSLLSPLSTVAVTPLATGVLFGGVPGTLLSLLPGGTAPARPFLWISGICARLMLGVTHAMADWPITAVAVRHDFVIVWACAVPLTLWFGRRIYRRRGVMLSAAALVLALSVGVTVYTAGTRDTITLSATDTKNGSLVLLQKEKRAALIVLRETNRTRIDTFLAAQGIDRLDFVLYTEQVNALPGEVAYRTDEWPRDEALTFWENGRLFCRDGWITVQFGQSCWQIAEKGALLSEKPETAAELLVFDRGFPYESDWPEHTELIVCGKTDTVSLSAEALASPSVRVTDRQTRVVYTRGKGDCLCR